ncbi:MAG TPA: hypothetical protein VFD72_05800 [Sphingobacteriaceae bacterium]|nr:hypothetical protein [Sphingobacteriaceae bacterium]
MNTITEFAVREPGFLMAAWCSTDPESPTRKQEDPPPAKPARSDEDPDASPTRKQEDPADAPTPNPVETPKPPGINREIR